MKERSDLASKETEEEREKWAEEREAEKEPMQKAADLIDSISFVRDVLDPRVILEAKDLGVGEEELLAIRGRMEKWVDAVRMETTESYQQRDIRLRELEDELFPEVVQGCGCLGRGMKFARGDFRRRDGRVVNNVEFFKVCDCQLGRDKKQYLEDLAAGRRGKGGKKKKPKNDEDAIPF